jgi:hypothetical protein
LLLCLNSQFVQLPAAQSSQSLQLSITINKVDYHDPPNSAELTITPLSTDACRKLKDEIQRLQDELKGFVAAGIPQPMEERLKLEGMEMEYNSKCVGPFRTAETQYISVSIINPLSSR